MKLINEINLNNKIVLINGDLNANLSDKSIITKKIKDLMNTINYALNQKAKVIITSHMSTTNSELDSIRPIAIKLCNELNRKIYFDKFSHGMAVDYALEKIEYGDLLFLELNKKNDEQEEFARYWIDIADVFINDDLSVSYKENEAILALAKYSKNYGCGFKLNDEIKLLNSFKNDTYTKPLVAIISGTLNNEKLATIKKLLSNKAKVLVAGDVACTFLKAKNIETGNSFVATQYLSEVKELLQKYKDQIVTPIDFYCADNNSSIKHPKLLQNQIDSNYSFLDIGKATLELFTNEIKDANTVLWDNILATKKEAVAGTFQLLKILDTLDGKNTILVGNDLIEVACNLGLDKNFKVIFNETIFCEFYNENSLESIDVINVK